MVRKEFDDPNTTTRLSKVTRRSIITNFRMDSS